MDSFVPSLATTALITMGRGNLVQFSDNVAFLEPSATLALAARARKLASEGRSVVDLSTGEPAYDTPEYAARAGIRAIEEGRTGYPPTRGIPSLREAVARYVTETTEHGSSGPDRVLVSAGVKQALFNCLFCLFDDGDEVLFPAPYWPTYPAAVRLTGAEPRPVPTRWEEGFALDVDRLEERRTPRTRGLIINSPCNPTGAVHPRETLERICRWCSEHGIWLLSDEIYRRLCWTAERAPSLWDVRERPDRSVLLMGASKAFCMPGWRVGFALGPPELLSRASDLQSQTTSGAAAPSQYAAAEAYRNAPRRERALEELRQRLTASREMAVEGLSGLEGLEVRPPEGAIYVYGRLTGDRPCTEVVERLLLEAGVAAVPGEAFGSPGFVRFNFSVRPGTLEEGVDRLRDFFGS